MKIINLKITLLLIATIFFSFATREDSVAQSKLADSKVIGYVDKNKDGINDRFADANGDGINDVTKMSYPHDFKFKDVNKDGINDIWQDRDGDGVNDIAIVLAKANKDYAISWYDSDGDGLPNFDPTQVKIKNIKRYILDVNNDGKNDITGRSYKKSLSGYRYGKIIEENNSEYKKFMDKDGDGMDDRCISTMEKGKMRPQHDFFIP